MIGSAARKETLVLYSILVGLIAGWLAGQVMRGRGYGILIDVLLGLVGGVIGRLLLGTLGLSAIGLIGSIVVAFVGAVVLVAIAHAVSRA
jgi:uncharacterized membrane protein YeaQ/YmgE (transglycosylase-associated protein family)